jgi:hypothetical protein
MRLVSHALLVVLDDARPMPHDDAHTPDELGRQPHAVEVKAADQGPQDTLVLREDNPVRAVAIAQLHWPASCPTRRRAVNPPV